MKIQQVRRHLLPLSEHDPKFRDYLRRLSYSGLQTVGIVEIAVPVLMLFGRLAVGIGMLDRVRLAQTAALALTGAATLLVSAASWSRHHARLLAVISAFVAPTVLTWSALWQPSEYLGADDYVLMGITLVVLTAVATVPLLPWHALSLGMAITGMYILSCSFAVRWELPSSPLHSDAHYIFLVMLALLATGVAATNYEHRSAEHQANQDAVRVAEALAGAQLRAQLAENAISIGKMAAALSHEINSPLGTLLSSVETLTSITDRQVGASPLECGRLDKARAELLRTIEQSTSRIQDVAQRLRRFVNLEEAELKSADVNELLSDVALLHEEQLEQGHIRLEFDLEKGLPPLTCRPQLLSSVFSTVLSNAIDAVNGDGHIAVETRREDSAVEVTIRDNGRGMRPEEADTIFDPSFKIEGGRVASGNWSLFNSRQIVYEHGGEIRVETATGQGTAVHITLPAS